MDGKLGCATVVATKELLLEVVIVLDEEDGEEEDADEEDEEEVLVLMLVSELLGATLTALAPALLLVLGAVEARVEVMVLMITEEVDSSIRAVVSRNPMVTVSSWPCPRRRTAGWGTYMS